MAAPDLTPRHVVFRSAVITGCVALLLGVAGIFYFHDRDLEREGAHPRDAATVVVHGLASAAGIHLRVRWQDMAGAPQEETGRTTLSIGHWTFRRAPEGAPLTLDILRRVGGGEPQLLHTQPAVFTRGAHFEVWVPAAR